jgi:hypothetical protein
MTMQLRLDSITSLRCSSLRALGPAIAAAVVLGTGGVFRDKAIEGEGKRGKTNG